MIKVREVKIVKEVIAYDFSPMAMFFISKDALGSQKHVEKCQEFAKKILKICKETLFSLLFQICFQRPKCFQISPLNGSPQYLSNVIIC